MYNYDYVCIYLSHVEKRKTGVLKNTFYVERHKAHGTGDEEKEDDVLSFHSSNHQKYILRSLVFSYGGVCLWGMIVYSICLSRG